MPRLSLSNAACHRHYLFLDAYRVIVRGAAACGMSSTRLGGFSMARAVDHPFCTKQLHSRYYASPSLKTALKWQKLTWLIVVILSAIKPVLIEFLVPSSLPLKKLELHELLSDPLLKASCHFWTASRLTASRARHHIHNRSHGLDNSYQARGQTRYRSIRHTNSSFRRKSTGFYGPCVNIKLRQPFQHLRLHVQSRVSLDHFHPNIVSRSSA